jgi:hypothetical protein
MINAFKGKIEMHKALIMIMALLAHEATVNEEPCLFMGQDH